MPYLLNLLYVGILLAFAPILVWKGWRNGKYREGWSEKALGKSPRRIGDRPCVWFHAVSVGEVLLLKPILADLARRRPDWDVVLAVLHGGVNRAILSYALTGERALLGNLEQSPGCINVLDVGDDWVVRAVNTTPLDLTHRGTRLRTMEELWAEFRA